MKLRNYFIAGNIVFLTLATWLIFPNMIFTLRDQTTERTLRDRQIAIMDENYHLMEENTALLADFQETSRYIIQPAGYIGSVLTEVRELLHLHSLTERDFFAAEQGIHYIESLLTNTIQVAETAATIAAYGSYENIENFLYDLANHYRYIRLSQVQISKEFNPTQFWISFSIYEAFP